MMCKQIDKILEEYSESNIDLIEVKRWRKKEKKKIYKHKLYSEMEYSITANGWVYDKVCLDEPSNYH